MMKSPVAVAVRSAVCFLVAASASAADIENEDEDSYKISISGISNEDAQFELAPGTRQSDVCAMRCMVQVQGIGSIVADEDELVVIRKRRLSKEPKQL